MLTSPAITPSASAGTSATAWAASSVKPPPKTASRRNAVRSSGSSRSSLQAIAARSARCRSGRSAALVVSRGRRRSSRVRIAGGDSTFTRAAASSIASGSPSSRRQMSAIARTLARSSANRGCTAWARARNSATDATRATAAGLLTASASGRGRGGRDLALGRQAERFPAGHQSVQPGTRSSKVARLARAGTICSKLSSTSRT